MHRFLVVLLIATALQEYSTTRLSTPNKREEVLASFVKEVHRTLEECLMVLCHDYKHLPLPLSNLLTQEANMTALPIQWTKSTPSPPVNSGPDSFEYWFSYLERPTARHLAYCRLIVLINHEADNFIPMFRYGASLVRMNPRQDRVIYFSPDSDIQPAMLDYNHQFLYQMGVIYNQQSFQLQIVNKCHFCSGGSPGIVPRGSYSMEEGVAPKGLELYPDYSTNLEGQLLNSTWALDTTTDDIKYSYSTGIPVLPYMMFLLHISEQLNYVFETMRPEPVPGYADEQRMDDGNYTGVIGAYQRRQSLIASMFVTEKGMSVADFPNNFYSSYMTFSIRLPNPLYSWTSMFKPYTLDMWAGITFSAILSSLVFLILLKSQYSISHPFPDQLPPKSHVLYSFRYIFSALIEENPNLIPSGSSIRVLICFWWLFCDLIVCGYEAKFFGFLVSPDLEPLPGDYLELSTWKKWNKGAMEELEPYIRALMEPSEVEYHQEILQQLVPGKGMVNCLLRSVIDDFACVGDSDLLYALSYLWMDLEGHLPVQVVPDTSLRVIGGLITVKYSVLTPVLRRTSARWDQSGVYIKHLSDFAIAISNINLKSARARNLLYKQSMELKVDQVKGPLLMLCVMLLVSAVVFVWELIGDKCKRHK